MSGNETSSRWTVRKALWVIAAHLAVLPFALYALADINTSNNVEEWLPADDPHAVVLNWFRNEFGLEQGLLASWDGATLNDPRVEEFATALAGPVDEEGNRHDAPPGIKSVRTPRELIRQMIRQGVSRDEAIRRATGLLVGTGPLKIRLTPAGRSEKETLISRASAEIEEAVGIEVQELPPAVDEFYAQAVARFQEREDALDNEFSGPGADDPYADVPPHDFQLRWEDMVPQGHSTAKVRDLLAQLKTTSGEPAVEETFFAPGAPVAIAVTLSSEGEENAAEMIDLIRETAIDVGIPEPDLHMGGAPVGEVAMNRATDSASWNPDYPVWLIPKRSPLITSALVGLGTAFIVLRSVRLAILVIMTALYVALLTTALVPVSGRNFNMVLLVMPNLLIVLTASGAIHVANYWRHAAHEKMDGAIAQAVRMAWQPCLLASVTTAIGLSSLVTSLLSPVREFGAFSAVGCLVSVTVVLWGFPALLTLWRGNRPKTQVAHESSWKQFGHWLFTHGSWVSATCLAVFLTCLAGLQHFRTETKVIKYFPEHTRIIADYRFLEENLAGVVPIEIIVSFNDTQMDAAERMELIRQLKNRISENPDISGTLALSDFRPPLELPPADASRLAQAKYSRTVHAIEEYLSAEKGMNDDGLTTHAGRPLVLDYAGRHVDIPRGAELWRIRAQVAVLSDVDYTDLTGELDDLLAAELSDDPQITHVVTGTVPLFLRTQEAVLESLIRSFGLAFGVIAVVMMVLLRNVLAGLITMVPNLLPIGVVFGIISWVGVPVDIGTMITASVALGIAIDGTLHLLTWFRDGLRNGMTREDAIALGLAHCGPAMWQTSAAIGLGLLMLAGTDLLLISRFGWLMAALIAAALIADIVFLPALLAGPLGSLIERNTQPTLLDPAETASLAESEIRAHSESAETPAS